MEGHLEIETLLYKSKHACVCVCTSVFNYRNLEGAITKGDSLSEGI